MSTSMAGKVVFITGAARGIGAGIAREAAGRGAKIALAGLEPAELEARAGELGEGHIHIECDVTDFDSVNGAVAETVERLGGIDVVVANAGIVTYGTIEKGDPDAWLRTVDINLNGVYRTVHAALPHVIERRGYVGVVCSIASFAPLAGMSSYNATKAGAEAFVRALRMEVGFRGVEAGAIHPSWIDTDMVRGGEQDLASFREAKAKLPWPLKSTTSLEKCSELIVDGIEARKARIFIPKAAAVAYYLRTLITSAAGERVASREAAEMVPRLEAEVAALGRSAASHTTKINDLEDARAESPAL